MIDKGYPIPKVFSFHRSSRAVQAAWLLFALFTISLALPGISAYRRLLEQPCLGFDCLPGQLLPREAHVVLLGPGAAASYSGIIFSLHLFACALTLLLAAFLALRKPRLPAAVWGAFSLTAASTVALVQAKAADVSGLWPAVRMIQLVQIVALALFLCLAPAGRFHHTWLRWWVVALALAATVAVFLPTAQFVALVVIIAIVLVALQIGFSYRTSTGAGNREAAFWTLAAASLFAAAQALDSPFRPLPFRLIEFEGQSQLIGTFTPLFGLLLIVGALTCLAVVFFRDELFSIEVAVNRAVVYSLLSLFVIGGYVLVVGYLSLIFRTDGSLWFSLVATGVIAALFQPLRQGVQNFVNYMIYGQRDEPYAVISQLGDRLQSAIAMDEVIPTVLHTIRNTLKASFVRIELEPGTGGQSFSIVDGMPGRNVLTLPLTVQNETIGLLHVGARPGEAGFSAANRLLLNGLARQAGAAIHSARQNAELKAAREQLVIAREEERRRIRRDLHDGLGASLAAINMQAGEVQRLIVGDPQSAAERMNDLRLGLREAVGDTRRLVYGLRPPALDELGLAGAIRSHLAVYESVSQMQDHAEPGEDFSPLALRLEATEPLPPLPAAVEVAAYRIVEASLANIAHHSRAKNGWVRLCLEGRGLRIEVCDDGVGLPPAYRQGVGIHSMRERVAELGGDFSVQPTPGGGTTINAWLPLPEQTL